MEPPQPAADDWHRYRVRAGADQGPTHTGTGVASSSVPVNGTRRVSIQSDDNQSFCCS